MACIFIVGLKPQAEILKIVSPSQTLYVTYLEINLLPKKEKTITMKKLKVIIEIEGDNR